MKRISEAPGPEIGSFYGNTVRAGFCDSLEVEAETYWTDNFLDELISPAGTRGSDQFRRRVRNDDEDLRHVATL